MIIMRLSVCVRVCCASVRVWGSPLSFLPSLPQDPEELPFMAPKKRKAGYELVVTAEEGDDAQTVRVCVFLFCC